MDIIEFQKRWIMRYINPIFFYLPFQSCQVNEIGFYIKVLLWNTYNPVKDEYKKDLLSAAYASNLDELIIKYPNIK